MAERYHLSGTYFEGCRCATACPCGDDCPTSRCDVAVGWRIEEGSVAGTDLSGLSVVGVYSTPDFADGRVDASLIIDQRANAEQQRLLREIFTGRRGGQLARLRPLTGEFREVKTAPIEFADAGGRGRLRVPGVLEGELEAVRGARFFQ